jgi:hypothetical protein
LADWRSIAPIAGAGVLAVVGAYFLFKPKREDPNELERGRRSYLNRVGRIVEGHIVEIVDHANAPAHSPVQTAAPTSPASPAAASKTNLKAAGKPDSKSASNSPSKDELASSTAKPASAFLHRSPAHVANGAQRLLYYSYSISGVTYETAQDVTGMEERIHLSRVAAGQTASVKYDPSNPSNSILLSDDWSGLH